MMQLKTIPHHWEARMVHLMEVEMAVNNSNWRENVLDLNCCKQDTILDIGMLTSSLGSTEGSSLGSREGCK